MNEFEVRANKAIGMRLRKARKLRELTLVALAAKAGIAFQLIQRYETGANGMSAARLEQLAGILRMPIGYFFRKDGKRSA
jgi:transcriptional regulator with XRE-family HTH domain